MSKQEVIEKNGKDSLSTSKQLEASKNSDSLKALTNGQPLIFAGRTTPGSTNWQPYPGGGGVFVDVETDLNIKATPIYIVSLGGRTNHSTTTGGDCVYPIDPNTNVPDAKGFRIHVMGSVHEPLTPALVNLYCWHINWIAIVNG